MDDFKDINDHYGHPMGDYVLKEAVDIMRHYAPAGARIGRIGGDEFMVCWSAMNISGLKTFGRNGYPKNPQHSVERHNSFSQLQHGVGGGIRANVSYDDLYRKADDALYHAKQLGKNRLYSVFSEQTENQLNPLAKSLKNDDAKL